MTGETVRAIREVIGEQVRRLREEAGLRQDDLSRAARLYGLTWDRARIGDLERGEKALDAEELALVPVFLGVALGRPVTLKDLVPVDVLIQLSPTTTGTGEAVLAVYAAELVGGFVTAEGGELVPGVAATVVAMNDNGRAVVGIAPDDAEVKAARKLGVPPIRVAETALRLWGCSLSERRDRMVAERADAGSDPDRLRAIRGRVTRVLVNEMEQAIRLGSAEERSSEDQD